MGEMPVTASTDPCAGIIRFRFSGFDLSRPASGNSTPSFTGLNIAPVRRFFNRRKNFSSPFDVKRDLFELFFGFRLEFSAKREYLMEISGNPVV